MIFQIPRKVFGCFVNVVFAAIQSDSVHSAFCRAEAGGSSAAKGIKEQQRRGKGRKSRKRGRGIDHHPCERDRCLSFILQDFRQILGQVGRRMNGQGPEQSGFIFRKQRKGTVSGKILKLMAVQFTAFKSQEDGIAEFLFPDLCVNRKGTQHGIQFTAGKHADSITITDICMSDQLKRIDHDVLFSSEIGFIIAEKWL